MQIVIKNRILARSNPLQMVQIKVPFVRNATLQCYSNDISLFFFTFYLYYNFALLVSCSCNVHRPRGHPSWMTTPIQGRRFYDYCDSFSSPVAARDLTCSFELNVIRHACRSALDCLRLCDNGHQAPIRRCGGATGRHIDFLRGLDTGYYRSAKKFRAVSGKGAPLVSRNTTLSLFTV